MATYKNIPILQNADTIAEIPAYTQSLAESLSEEQDFISLTLVSPFSGYVHLRKYGNMVHCVYNFSRSSGTATATVATIPVGWRPTYDIETWVLTSATSGGTKTQVKILTTGVITEDIGTATTASRRPTGPVIWAAA